MTNPIRHHAATILTLCLLIVTAWKAEAQNNPFKIKDDLYALYLKASGMIGEKECLTLSDKMYRQAMKQGDKKAECLAWTLKARHYNSRKEFDKLSKTTAELRRISRANGYLQYFYYAMRIDIIALMNNDKMIQAINLTEEMKDMAVADNYAFGIFSGLRTLGDIYEMRNAHGIALNYYKEAADFMRKNIHDQDPAAVYLKIAQCLFNMNAKNKEAIKYCDMVIKDAKTVQTRELGLMLKCKFMYYAMDEKDFNATYRQLTGITKEKGGQVHSRTRREIDILKLIIDGKYDEAIMLADSLNSWSQSIETRKKVSLRKGDFESAYRYHNLQIKYNDSVNSEIMLRDIAEINASVNYDKLRRDKMLIELQNTQLELAQKNQALALEAERSERVLLAHKNHAMETKQAKMRADLLAADVKMQKGHIQMQRNEMEKEKANTRVKITIFCSLILLLICVTIYLYDRRRKNRKHIAMLQDKNAELTEAREAAEAANKMKTVFIQNMNHEIRTPLNAIVGFTQLMRMQGKELSDEELEEFTEIINKNSELLTTIIDDILRLADMESGKYNMMFAEHKCNKICKMAVETVMHRKPEGVRLYFTSDAPDDYTLVTDRQRVEQVLINYLTNAEKYTEKGEIRLHCSITENEGKVTFSVTDTGSGIPKEQAEAVFERFKKLDKFKQGTGLGLNICRTIAEKLHGETKLDTSYTGGARFLLILPTDLKVDEPANRRVDEQTS